MTTITLSPDGGLPDIFFQIRALKVIKHLETAALSGYMRTSVNGRLPIWDIEQGIKFNTSHYPPAYLLAYSHPPNVINPFTLSAQNSSGNSPRQICL
jgi:hypothetical protein